MAKQIQVSTIAQPRDEYTSKFQPNTEVKQEWIPKKSSVLKKLKFEYEKELLSDDYVPVYKSYTSDDTFVAPSNGCVAFVLCVGGSGYGSATKGWSEYYRSSWSDPVGGWQIDDQTDCKTQLYNKVLKRRDYKHNPPASSAMPSCFGVYLSANAGLNIAKDTVTMYQNYRTWTIRGWASDWDWGGGQYRYRSETQNVGLSSGSYDGNLVGSSGAIKFGIFTLKPNEAVHISVGRGAIRGHVDVVYFELRNGSNEAIEKPSKPNDVIAGIPLPKPTPPQSTTPTQISLSLSPLVLELEVGSTSVVEIITNATSYTYSIDENIASFDETSKEISANAQGETMLAIECVLDKQSIKRAIAIKVIEKQVIQPTIPNTPQQNTTQLKVINASALYPNLSGMDEEQLAYMYVVTLCWSKVFALAQNDNAMTLMVMPLSAEVKQDLQNIYNSMLTTDKTTLMIYARSGYDTLATHISSYPLVQNRDEARLQTLESLIRYEEGVENGVSYNHVFTDEVRGMSNGVFVDNLTTIWIKELDGIITRSPKSTTTPTTPQSSLDSISVTFSKTPNSYIHRSKAQDELYVGTFAHSWDDPMETDYIHELYWYVTYSATGVNYTMQKVQEVWLAQKNHTGDNNVSNTAEKRQTFINVGVNKQIGAIGQILRKAYETDMKGELFEEYNVSPYKMKLKNSIYAMSKTELLELYTRACQKVYAISK